MRKFTPPCRWDFNGERRYLDFRRHPVKYEYQAAVKSFLAGSYMDRYPEMVYEIQQDGLHAVQLLQASPILALAIYHPRTKPVGGKQSQMFKKQLRSYVRRGLKLKRIMSAAGIPWPYRKLPVHAARRLLPILNKLDPRLIQYMPVGDPKMLRRWIISYVEISRMLARGRYDMRRSYPVDFMTWLVKKGPDLVTLDRRSDFVEISHWAQRNRDGRRWNDKMDFEVAYRETLLWHDRLAIQQDRAFNLPFPDPWVPLERIDLDDGWSMQPVKTPRDLQKEGAELRHCVYSYVPDIRQQICQIYSLRDQHGRRQITVEIGFFRQKGDWPFQIREARGYANRLPTNQEWNYLNWAIWALNVRKPAWAEPKRGTLWARLH